MNGAVIAKGVIGLALGIGILILAVVLAIAYLPGFEAFFTGMANQMVKWAHQIHGGNTGLQSPVKTGG